MSDEPINPLAEEIEALGRVAMTSDGRLLHRFLRRMVEATCISDQGSALPRHEGGRMFAATLMRHMAEGIDSSSGRTDSSSADRSILARSGKPVAVHASRGAQRRVALEPGDGWNPGDGNAA